MSRLGDWLYKQAVQRGVNRDLVAGSLQKADQRGGTLRVLPTVLTSLQNQLQQANAPDPTLGTPFASRVPSSDWSTVAQMGPGQPATPFPLGGEPRQWVYRVGWNFPTPPDSDRKIDGQLLRQLADSFFLLRRALEVRKAEICALEWDIVPSAEALQDPRYGKTQRERAKYIQTEFGPLMKKLRDFFRYPEGYYTTRDGVTWVRKGTIAWKDWLNAVVEDYFVGDWVTLWPEPTLGGELLSLARVDGEHTKVLLTLDGRLPQPPLPAYQQYLYGVPRANFTQDDLYFWPRNLRNITPYGFSHVEQMLILTLLGLKFDQWNVAMYTESTMPMGLLEGPEGVSPDQIQDIADFLNGQVANLPERLRIHPVPNGTKFQAIKPFNFDPNIANWIVDLTCAAMDVTRQELGFAPSNSEGLGGSGHAEAQTALDKRKGTVPLARWLEEKMNRVIRDWFDPEGVLEFRFTEFITEDLNAKYEANDKALRSGQLSLDQVLEDLGGQGIGMGHFIETKVGVILPEEQLLITGNGVQPLKPSAPAATPGMTGNPAQDAQTAAVHQVAHQQTQGKSAQATVADENPTTQEDRQKLEEAFLAAWLTWMTQHRETALGIAALNAAQVREAFQLDPAQITELTDILNGTRAEAYVQALQALPPETFNPAIDIQDAVKRLVEHTAEHAHEIADTWNSDVQREADRIESTGADPNLLRDQLAAWMAARLLWKGQQIAITEITDAQAQAQADWAANSPARSVGMMRWTAVIDERTCAACRDLDGQLVSPTQTSPPAHPNCRCTLTQPGSLGDGSLGVWHDGKEWVH